MLASLSTRPTLRPAQRLRSSLTMAPKRKTQSAAPASKKTARKGLASGDQFPTLPPLTTDEETQVNLNDVLKESGVLLFSYPKANTSGCTAQATGFNNVLDELTDAGFRVFGISADKPTSQANWKAKHGFKFNLLCDPDHSLALKTLGWSKGGTSVARSHVVVAKGGKVVDYQSPIGSKDSVVQGVETVLKAGGK